MAYATPAFAVGDAFRKRTFTLAGAVRALREIIGYAREARRLKAPRLPGDFREALALAVTYVNRCRHCYFAHSTFGRVEGLTDAEIAQLDDLPEDVFDRRRWTALSYAKAWAESNGAPADEHREALAREYSDADIAAIQLTLATMRFANLTANTGDALLSRLKGKPRPHDDGGLGSEIIIGVLWGVCAIPVGLLVVVWRMKLRRDQSTAGVEAG